MPIRGEVTITFNVGRSEIRRSPGTEGDPDRLVPASEPGKVSQDPFFPRKRGSPIIRGSHQFPLFSSLLPKKGLTKPKDLIPDFRSGSSVRIQ